MKVLYMPRQSGKTTQAIREAARTGAHIVCRLGRVKDIQKRAQEMGFKVKTMSYGVFIDSSGRGLQSVIIDDVDELLRLLSNAPIDMITLSSGVL